MGEVDDGQPVAHLWRQEYDFWSSPLKACLQKVASIVVCVVLVLWDHLSGLSLHRFDW